MANQPYHRTPREVFTRRTCVHCHSLTIHWVWRLVEPGPRTYEILCVVCVAAQDATFTPERAIDQAAIVISRHQDDPFARPPGWPNRQIGGAL